MNKNSLEVGREVLVDSLGTMTAKPYVVTEILGDTVWMTDERGVEYCAPADRVAMVA
jgi:hypothetical protein